MTQRRPQPPRKRPDAGSDVAFATAAVGSAPVPATQAEAAPGFDAQKASEELLQEVRELLRAEVELDDDQREAFGAHFAQALQAVVQQQAQAGESPDKLDKGAWKDALSGMEAEGDVSPTEAADLSRRVEGALLPLERRPTQIALEFSRRMQAEGSEQALAWLREQRAGSDDSQESDQCAAPSGPPVAVGSDDVTRSRSRRLRGPPAGV